MLSCSNCWVMLLFFFSTINGKFTVFIFIFYGIEIIDSSDIWAILQFTIQM